MGSINIPVEHESDWGDLFADAFETRVRRPNEESEAQKKLADDVLASFQGQFGKPKFKENEGYAHNYYFFPAKEGVGYVVTWRFQMLNHSIGAFRARRHGAGYAFESVDQKELELRMDAASKAPTYLIEARMVYRQKIRASSSARAIECAYGNQDVFGAKVWEVEHIPATATKIESSTKEEQNTQP